MARKEKVEGDLSQWKVQKQPHFNWALEFIIFELLCSYIGLAGSANPKYD
jgi:hypothetical protein